jgi:hypothetical protein
MGSVGRMVPHPPVVGALTLPLSALLDAFVLVLVRDRSEM